MLPARTSLIAVFTTLGLVASSWAANGSSVALEDAMHNVRSSRRLGNAGGTASYDSEETLAEEIREEISPSPSAERMPQDIPNVEPTPGSALWVPVRRRRRVRDLTVSLDWVPLRLTQDQAGEKSTSFISVGRRIDTSVSFLPGGNIRENKEEKAGAMGVFLGEAAVHLYGMRLKVLSYTGAKGMKMTGSTPKIGTIRLVKVREVGDVRGEVVAEANGISFALGGKETVVPFDLSTDPKSRYMAVISMQAPKGVPAAMNIPVSSEGTYPALRLDPKSLVPLDKSKPLFDAAISFEYKPDPGVVRPNTKIEGKFIRSIRDYLEANPEADTVPLKVILN